VDTVSAIPVIGGFYKQILSGHTLVTWLALLAVAVTWWVLMKTRFGLRLRAVGENPAAVDTAGISVVKLRYGAIIICGVLCGLGGAYFSIAQGAGYLNNMTAGKGFIALAALIFAKWKPGPALGACLLFGFLDALAIRLQGAELPLVGKVPVQFIQVMPYVLTVVLLAALREGAVGGRPRRAFRRRPRRAGQCLCAVFALQGGCRHPRHRRADLCGLQRRERGLSNLGLRRGRRGGRHGHGRLHVHSRRARGGGWRGAVHALRQLPPAAAGICKT
jgi:ABC-type uncharacterized transport system permease subunit